jgi:hypothetical protein
MLSSSLLSILIKKGIITDDEIVSEFDIFLNSSKQKEMLESNRDQLMQCIEAEKDYNKELENMYEDMKSRVDITDQEFYKSSDTSYVDELFN